MSDTSDWNFLYDFAMTEARQVWRALTLIDHQVARLVRAGTTLDNPEIAQLMAEHDTLIDALRDHPGARRRRRPRMSDTGGRMKFRLLRVSGRQTAEIELETLADLLALVDREGEAIIVDRDRDDGSPEITIYDAPLGEF
jgi:hypothetical protein